MQDDAYTFLGNSKAGATLFMDIAGFESDDLARAHAMNLLSEHQSADLIQVWRAAHLVGEIARLEPSQAAAARGRPG
jgi:hypothetical protein